MDTTSFLSMCVGQIALRLSASVYRLPGCQHLVLLDVYGGCCNFVEFENHRNKSQTLRIEKVGLYLLIHVSMFTDTIKKFVTSSCVANVRFFS